MSVSISSADYLSGIDDGYSGDDPGDGLRFRDKPLLLWNSMIPPTGFTVSSTDTGAAGNMWAPDTYSFWKADDVTTTGVTSSEVVMDLSVATGINSVAVAKNNFHIAAPLGELKLHYWNGSSYVLIDSITISPKEQPYMFLFDVISGLPTRFRLTIETTNFVSSTFRLGALITHIKCGIAMVLRRAIYVGHEPYPFSRRTKKITNASESGQYLGQSTIRRYSAGSIEQKSLSPVYVREQILPFKHYLDEDSARLDQLFAHFGPFGTFFFAWRPYTYPEELQYCWTNDQIRFKNSLANGMMDWELEYEAYA